MRIETTSVEQRLKVLALAIAVGAKWHGGEDGMETPEQIEKGYPFSRYPTVYVVLETGRIAGNGAGDSTHSIGDFLAAIGAELAKLAGKPPTQVAITSGYIAVIGDKTTVVGCQTFDNKDILALAGEIKKQKPAVYKKPLTW